MYIKWALESFLKDIKMVLGKWKKQVDIRLGNYYYWMLKSN
jgi:hypothetical protein